jgi:hypothetical protein
MCYALLGVYDAPVTCETGGKARLLHPRIGGTMPIEIRKFALREGVQAEDFEKFMIEEVFPIVKTAYGSRAGMFRVHHSLLKTEPRRYWWTVELVRNIDLPVGEVQTGDEEFVQSFPTDIREVLGQLNSFATSTVSSPFTVLARTTEVIQTPSPAWFEGNRDGWFGHG